MSFETTSSNTGSYNGACKILQERLRRPLFHLACRHHILELVAEEAFSTCLGPSSGPEIALFKRFQTNWSFIDKGVFQPITPCDTGEIPLSLFLSSKEKVVLFFRKKLEPGHAREDYRELLELTVVLSMCKNPLEVSDSTNQVQCIVKDGWLE